MKWFKHYSVASQDGSMNRVIDEHGLIAYSYFWLLVEQCAAKYEGDGNFTFQLSMSQVRRLWRIRSLRVELLLHSYSTNNFFNSTIVEDLITISWPKLAKYVHKDAISSAVRPATSPPLAGQKKEKKEKYILSGQNSGPVKGKYFLTNEQALEIYRTYPRKEKRKEFLKKIQSGLKNQQLVDKFNTSLANYCKWLYVNKKEEQYVKLPTTFYSEWEDWLDPSHGNTELSVVRPADRWR